MTSFTSPNLRLISTLIYSSLVTMVGLATLAVGCAEAKNKHGAAPSDNRNAMQNQIDKDNAQSAKPDLYQTDYSKNFSYILPPGWQVTQNPMYPHDILVKQQSEGKGSIVLADQQAKGNLSKMSAEMVEELPKQCDDFKLVSSEMLKLPSGVNCARLTHTGKLGESEICQVNYLMPYTRGRILVITGTVIKGDSEGLKTVEKFTTSVKMKKKKLSL
jgi:hypothetical protein